MPPPSLQAAQMHWVYGSNGNGSECSSNSASGLGFAISLLSAAVFVPSRRRLSAARERRREDGSQKTCELMDLQVHFPVLHKEFTTNIKGIQTDIVICSYDDRYMVMATQIGSMGTMLQARKEEGVSIKPTFNVSVMFGKRDESMMMACARQLIEHISSSGSAKSLVLSLGLKDHTAETMKNIVSNVIENRLW